jgi:hypothetical protein
MKVVSLNLSTLGSGKYAPIEKSNLANVKWMVNWKEIMGDHYTSNHVCRIKAKLVSNGTTTLSTANNLGTVRMSFASNYSNIVNGMTVGIPIIRQTADTPSVITQFIGTISSTTLTVNSFGYGQMLSVSGGTGGASSATLTITSSIAIPIGSVITGNGISGYVTITAQTSATAYTMSSAQTITAATPLTAALPNNICLPVGTLITGNGVTANTVITAQTGAYTYTVNNSQTVGTIPMISNPNNYYFDLDNLEGDGLSISAPLSNYLSIQFLKPDEMTLMSNVPDYTVLLSFVFDGETF